MKNDNKSIISQNKRKVALIGGIGYLIIFITGIYANFVVLESLKVAGNKLATFQNLSNNQETFKMGIISFVFMLIADVVLTWCLYELFKSFNQRLSKITAWFRLVNVIFFGVALFYLSSVLKLTNPQEIINHGKEYLVNEVNYILVAFNNTWLVGLLFFGIHLVLLATLMFKYIRIPNFIPMLLMIAGAGYLVDSILQFTYTDYKSISEISNTIVVLPGIVGELSLTFWLLFYKSITQIKKINQNNYKLKKQEK